MAPRRKAKADHIEHGSAKHKALLGIDRQEDEKEKAKLQAALDAGAPPVMAENKRPSVNRRNYQQGQVIIDGWTRQGR